MVLRISFTLARLGDGAQATWINAQEYAWVIFERVRLNNKKWNVR